jgi:hypothetical protein
VRIIRKAHLVINGGASASLVQKSGRLFAPRNAALEETKEMAKTKGAAAAGYSEIVKMYEQSTCQNREAKVVRHPRL